jgi:hypothetical protein
MPTSKKSNNTSRPSTTKPISPLGGDERGRRIRQDRRHEADRMQPDARDVDAGIVPAKTTTAIDISRAPERGQALELAKQLEAIVITDRESYRRAKELYAAGKDIKRKMSEHWQRITRSIDALKKTMFGFRDDDMGALDHGLVIAERIIIDFENAERDRIRREEERRRQEAEAKAKEERERELAKADALAFALEEKAEGLSQRELWFVEKVFEQRLDVANPTALDLRAMQVIAKQAGYKDVDTQVARLLRSPKILDALKAKHDARAIREQAQAKREQPIDVAETAPVETPLDAGRGLRTTRTYYSAEVVDVQKLREAYIAGDLNLETLIPNEVYLNSQARTAKSAEIFEKAFPGCRLKTKQSI